MKDGKKMKEDASNIIGVCGDCKDSQIVEVKRRMEEGGLKVEPGDIVKVRFEQDGLNEHMWVRVTQVLLGGDIRGILDNQPIIVENVKYGQVVVKSQDTITGFIRGKFKINPVNEK